MGCLKLTYNENNDTLKVAYRKYVSDRNSYAEAYSYGFNGKEKDASTEWGDVAYDYGFRIYNPGLGKFLSVDPLTAKYAFYSPYHFAGNTPIQAIDLDGLEPRSLIDGTIIKFPAQAVLQKLKSTDYSLWGDMLQWEKSQEYKNVLKDKRIFTQPISMAAGKDLNTDYYAITIDKMPPSMSKNVLYGSLRKMLGEFIDKDIADFSESDSKSNSLWQSNNPQGSIMVFKNQMDNAPVIVSQSREDHWVFSPISTLNDFEHPLAGHREFGLSEESGSLIFYTRGVDRMYGILDQVYNSTQKGGRFFRQADKLWSSLMEKVAAHINSSGGSAKVTHRYSRQISWSKDVKQKDK